jgi:hypothetical protein
VRSWWLPLTDQTAGRGQSPAAYSREPMRYTLRRAMGLGLTTAPYSCNIKRSTHLPEQPGPNTRLRQAADVLMCDNHARLEGAVGKTSPVLHCLKIRLAVAEETTDDEDALRRQSSNAWHRGDQHSDTHNRGPHSTVHTWPPSVLASLAPGPSNPVITGAA